MFRIITTCFMPILARVCSAPARIGAVCAACVVLGACGYMGEPGGLFQWPNGNCLWPCIGGGGGSTVYGQSYQWQGVTYYEFYD